MPGVNAQELAKDGHDAQRIPRGAAPAPGTGPTCHVDGCDRPLYARGYCHRDYRRVLANGDPNREFNRPNPLPAAELAHLRRAVGVPDNGPDDETLRRWRRQEREVSA